MNAWAIDQLAVGMTLQAMRKWSVSLTDDLPKSVRDARDLYGQIYAMLVHLECANITPTPEPAESERV